MALAKSIARNNAKALPKNYNQQSNWDYAEMIVKPGFQGDTDRYQRTGFTDPRADLKRTFQRNTSDYSISNNRMLQDIAAARQQRDWTQAGQTQGQNQQFGGRGLDMSSPTAQKLQARLQAMQQFNTDQQEQGFTRTQKDSSTAQARMNTDYGTSTSRLGLAEQDFLDQRKKALDQLLLQEEQRRSFNQ